MSSPPCITPVREIDRSQAERRTRWVTYITFCMMVVEIVVGMWSGSRALSADGWHMATHAGALGLSAFAYSYARNPARRARFAFGPGKVLALAGFANAVVLLVAAALIAVDGVGRLFSPVTVSFAEAFPIAVLGLVVNLGTARLLDHDHAPHDHDHAHSHEDKHAHDHESDHAHDHAHGQDHNLRAAYLHIVADALTSVAAIVALLLGRYLGWWFLDPLMAVIASAVIVHWGIGLCRSSATTLLDIGIAPEQLSRVSSELQTQGVEVADLHVWNASDDHRVAIVTVRNPQRVALEEIHSLVKSLTHAQHVTIESAES